MPIPEPTPGQDKATFLQACMADDTMGAEYPDPAQRYAVCLSQWGKRTGSTPSSSPAGDGWPSSPF